MDWQFTPFICVLGFAALVALAIVAVGLWHRNRASGRLIGLRPVARDRLVESLEDGVIVIDDQGRIADVNPAAERMLGTTDLVGTRALDAFAQWAGIPVLRLPTKRGQNGSVPKDAPSATPPLADILPTEGEIITETAILEWRVAPLDIRRNPSQIIVLHDITERKRAEAAMQSLNATLEFRVAERTAEILAEKNRSDAILRNISDSIMMTDRDRYILYANPAFTRLSGYDVDEALGCPVADILGTEVDTVLDRAQTYGESCHEETTLLHKNHRAIAIAITVSQVRRCNHDIAGYVCTLRDITQLKNLERARKSFIDNISHQLRTPVTTLRLYAHLMAQGNLAEQSRSYLDVITRQTASLQHLIEDMLEVTSLDSGQAIGVWKAVSPATILDHIVTRYQSQAERAGLCLHSSVPIAPLPNIMGDQTRLTQAMSEIADNALRFTPAGGDIIMGVGTVEDDSGRAWVVLSITDTGPGIPEAERPRIFDRFFRGTIAEAGHFPGTGLGLSIAEAIIHAHGGRITLQTNQGGTTFTVWLPAVPAEAEPASTGSNHGQQPSTTR